MLRNTINELYIKYFKERNFLKDAYSDIKTKILLQEKELKRELSDLEVQSIIEQYVKKVSNSIKDFEKDNIVSEIKDKLVLEVRELEQFIEKSLEWKELEEKVSELMKSGINNIGQFMWELSKLGKVNKWQAKEFFNLMKNK